MSFNSKLTDLLKTDPRLVDDEGELVIAAIQDRAWKIDRDLVKLLLSDKEIKAKFFDEIEKHWIFNINTFIDYISQKNFLDNSYTRFRNRIGLTIGDKYLCERGDVALVWPYKDCVLEGGQTKEEEKRKEIFFNEVLAQDEINRLLDPKVLTSFTRYTAKGKEKVKTLKRDENGVIRENLIIKGNNLLALHTLNQQFRGQVKLIYIDPPYNTDKTSDSFGYNDKFTHSTWLTFMKNRLEIAAKLLRPDGVLLINIDEIEHAYLNILCDEIFNKDNYIGDLIWKKRKGGGNDSTFLALDHDYILVYVKDRNIHETKWRVSHSADYLKRYKEVDENGENFYWDTLSRDGLQHPIIIEIACPDGSKIIVNSQKSRKTVLKELSEEKIKFVKVNGNWTLHHRVYQPEGQVVRSILDKVGTNKTAGDELEALFGQEIPIKHPKPELLLSKLIEFTTNKGDIVVDFFIGSGTTAAVSHKMTRQYIGIEQMDYIESISVERLKKVIAGEQGGISKSINWQGGGDFIYCELMKYNEVFIDRIQAAESSKELLKVWKDMAEGSFLNWYINPKLPEEAIKNFEALGKEENGLEKQKHLLAGLLDKNQLYVNLSEIDDAQFMVSAEDKALNKAFYGEDYNA